MGQRTYDLEKGEQEVPREKYPALFKGRTEAFGGFDYNFLPRKTFDDTEEERLKTYESLWQEGDFKFWLATYYDMLFDEKANREAYNFWRDKTRAKINDERVKNILAPSKSLLTSMAVYD